MILQREHELRQKLIDTTLELEAMKNMRTELFNLLKTAYQERDEAKNQLQKLMNNLSPIHFQDKFIAGFLQENPPMFHPSNPSITESSSLSHGSPPVDSFFETVSSPEFSNTNMAYLNHHQNQHFNYLRVPNEKPVSDHGTVAIDSIAKEKVLPQKGKLLQAVIDAGPLLQTILLAGPLPTWSNPPPLQDIQVPPLNIKVYDNDAAIIIDPVSFPAMPKFSSNVMSTCSASSMLNFAGNHVPYGSRNNSWKYSSDSSSSSKRQRYQ